jgi:hypothetical protein
LSFELVHPLSHREDERTIQGAGNPNSLEEVYVALGKDLALQVKFWDLMIFSAEEKGLGGLSNTSECKCIPCLTDHWGRQLLDDACGIIEIDAGQIMVTLGKSAGGAAKHSGASLSRSNRLGYHYF